MKVRLEVNERGEWQADVWPAPGEDYHAVGKSRKCLACKKIHSARYEHRVRKQNKRRSPERIALLATHEAARAALAGKE
jgi:hypothetical protein